MPRARPFAVLFDLDGTLVDTVGLILASVRYAFDGRPGACPSDAQWIAGIGMPLRTQLAAFVTGPEELEQIVARYRIHYRAHQDGMTRCFPGALETARLLKERGHPTAVVTSKISELTRQALERVGLAPWIDVAVSADSCERHKPDPAPVRLALERLGRESSESILVGDSPHDIAAGNAAGAATVAAVWGACSRETLERAAPRYVLEAIGDLPGLVDTIQAVRPAPVDSA